MTRSIKTFTFLFLLAVLGSTVVGPSISIKNISPDFLIMVIVIVALAEGALAATIVGFLFGIVLDLSQPELMGLHALCCSLAGFSIGKLRGRLIMDSVFVLGGLVAIAVLSYEMLYLLIGSGVVGNEFIRPIFTSVIPTSIYSGLISIPVASLCLLFGSFHYED